jgi:hypothetical protein
MSHSEYLTEDELEQELELMPRGMQIDSWNLDEGRSFPQDNHSARGDSTNYAVRSNSNSGNHNSINYSGHSQSSRPSSSSQSSIMKKRKLISATFVDSLLIPYYFV